MDEQRSAAKRWGSLILGLALTWATVFVAGPALVQASPAMTHLANVIDENDIETGEFYYTDVEVCAISNLNTRTTIEYLPKRLAAK